MAGTGDTAWHEKLNLQHAVPGATEAAVSAEAAIAARQSLLRILPISQYLLEPASGVWALQFGCYPHPRA